jgi:hypothetical protein
VSVYICIYFVYKFIFCISANLFREMEIVTQRRMTERGMTERRKTERRMTEGRK